MAINKIPVKAFSAGDLATDVFTATAGQTAFTLSLSAVNNSTLVYVNDVIQAPSTDYNVNGTALTFTSGLTAGDEVIVRIIARPSVLNIVEDGAITTAKLATGAIEAKLGYTPSNPAYTVQRDSNTGAASIPSGSSLQRPASPVVGMLRFNTDFDSLEQYTTTGWKSIEAPPIISSITPTAYNGEQGSSITVLGSYFKSGAIVEFITKPGVSLLASTTTVVSSTVITATTPRDITVAEEPISIKVTNPSGLTTTLTDALDAGSTPSWVTASGSLGSVYDGYAASLQVAVSDPDVGATVSYSLVSGALPTGLSLNSSTGVISGTPAIIANDTTYTFTIRATDNAGNSPSDRTFSILVIATNYFGNAEDGTGSF